MERRIADVEDTFNIKMGGCFKAMARQMMSDVCGTTTIKEITSQEEWEKFLMEDQDYDSRDILYSDHHDARYSNRIRAYPLGHAHRNIIGIPKPSRSTSIPAQGIVLLQVDI